MSFLNLSSLMRPLGRQRDPSQSLDTFRGLRQPKNRLVEGYLLQKGISPTVAHSLAYNELAYWREDELDDVFRSLDTSPAEIQGGLLSFTVPPGALEEDEAGMFVKPSIDIIKKSVDEGGALCVNKSGEFCVNPPNGYAALSHVWSQGIGADDSNRGLQKCLLDQVFEKLRPLDLEWIWTDTLAIPGGRRKLSTLEEKLKGSLINSMPMVYQNARKVVIFDALVLRLDSVDPLKAAVTICMGGRCSRSCRAEEQR